MGCLNFFRWRWTSSAYPPDETWEGPGQVNSFLGVAQNRQSLRSRRHPGALILDDFLSVAHQIQILPTLAGYLVQVLVGQETAFGQRVM